MEHEFWKTRYETNQTGWHLNQVSPPIQAYVSQLVDKDLRILIPGAGFGHEADFLFENGFSNVVVLDFVQEALNRIQERNPEQAKEHFVCGDFFAHEGEYDLILEQTLFCAINPLRRTEYAQKCASLLVDCGKFVGVLFNRDFEGGPPFGGNLTEYEHHFSPYFKSLSMKTCHNSIEPRLGSELFVKFIK
jgi:thiopurine S-methyltransferase